MYDFLSTNIEYLKGVGPARAQILRQEAHIHTFEDLLYYFPFRYINKNNIVKIAQIQDEQTYITVRGRIVALSEKGGGRQKRLVASLHDDTGHIDLIWFSGLKWIKDKLKTGQWVSAFGKPNLYQHQFSLAHPDIEILPPNADLTPPPADRNAALDPVYSMTETMKKKGVTIKSLTQMTRQLFASGAGSIPEVLPKAVLEKYRLLPREEALREMHFPSSPQQWQNARIRCKFEELFLLQINILQHKLSKKQQAGFIFADVGEQFLHFFNHNLPFELTGAQKRVIREIRQDTKTGFQMNRLLQGDVGSGKTMVALMVMLLAIDNGFQACLMAPTEILARQHHQSFLKNLQGLPVRTALLCGATPKAERKPLLLALAQGDIQILIGTHALLEDEVVFKNLGLAVIDEQHRFGVAQRAKLWAKNSKPPHVLVMTATPIPRTLGMTLYGDLDTSVIDELPPNRKPIQTLHFTDSARLRVFAFMREEIRKGRQINVVYPKIK
ncbi:MAG: ATP-dependent DNA helicase RecG [Bacteroidales bacterium]|nr:ATP-dependent DNA helicase RecG [Bacteroidales bacterium]